MSYLRFLRACASLCLVLLSVTAHTQGVGLASPGSDPTTPQTRPFSPPSFAQIEVGEILRRGGVRVPQQRQRPQRPQRQAADCGPFVEWIGILDKELPGFDWRGTPMPSIFQKTVNLFRDEYFEPFFGETLSRATPQERRAFQQTTWNPCARQAAASSAAAGASTVMTILQRAFLVDTGTYSSGEVIAALAERDALIKWQADVTRALGQATFADIAAHMKRARSDLTKLWPREQQAFINTLTQRQRTLARADLDAAIVSARTQAANGVPGARAIAAIQAAHAVQLQLLDPDAVSSYTSQFDTATATALRTALQTERAKLEALPSGLDGVLAINAWRRELETAFSGLPVTPDAAALVAAATGRRSALLKAGINEFSTMARQHPKPVRNGLNAAQLLDQLFEDVASRGVPEYAPYRAALDTRLSALAAEEAAENARRAAAETAEAARIAVASTGRCDTVAAHPDDPEAVARGVPDAALDAAAAVAACEPAIRRPDAPPRVLFQLARAYLKADRLEDATEQLVAAGKQGHGGALAYLGDLHLDGAPGIDPDPALAHTLYERAVEAGFRPAQAVLAQFQDFTAQAAAADEEEKRLVATDPGAAPFEEVLPRIPAQVRNDYYMKEFLVGSMALFKPKGRDRLEWLAATRGIQDAMEEACILEADLDFPDAIANQAKEAMPSGLDLFLQMIDAGRTNMPAPFINDIARAEQGTGPRARTFRHTLDLIRDFGGCEGSVARFLYRQAKLFVFDGQLPGLVENETRGFGLGELGSATGGVNDMKDFERRWPRAQALRIEEDVDAVLQTRPSVLRCRYLEADGKLRDYFFWHQRTPDAAEPGRLRAVVPNHPLLAIRAPRQSCPETQEAAAQ